MMTFSRSLVLHTGMQCPRFTNKKLKKHKDQSESSKVISFLVSLRKLHFGKKEKIIFWEGRN